MRITHIFVLVFILSAVALGVAWGEDTNHLNAVLDNASLSLKNITLEKGDNYYMDGAFTVIEEFVHFVGVGFVEFMRMGATFGSENPGYFEPDYLINLARLIVWLTIISLLIKPVFYLIIFIIMAVIYIKDIIKSRRSQGVGA